mmetsp:Transcript_9209/g.17977  ORF Transcript_9209/g.17977 Transcript_9209/m.17977 type:complete len:815 (+) Transcript_9209:3-2447(+)
MYEEGELFKAHALNSHAPDAHAFKTHAELSGKMLTDLSKRIKSRMSYSVPKSILQKRNSLQKERDTWMLQDLLSEHVKRLRETEQKARDRLYYSVQLEPRNFWYNFFEHFYVAKARLEKKQIPERTLDAMQNLLLAELVTTWFEKVAKKDKELENDTPVQEGELLMSYTKSRMPMETLVSNLDPDAPERENKNCTNKMNWKDFHEEDKKERLVLLSNIRKYVEMGELEEAQTLCRTFKYSFQAAMLEGAKVWRENVDEQEISERVFERSAWKKRCEELASKEYTPDDERLVFGLFGGNINHTQKMCDSWHTWCWAHFKHLVEYRCDMMLFQILDEAVHRMKFPCILPSGTSISDCKPMMMQLDTKSICLDVPFCEHEKVRGDSSNPYRVIQRLLIQQEDERALEKKAAGYVVAIASEYKEYCPIMGKVLNEVTDLFQSFDAFDAGRQSLYGEFDRHELDPDCFLQFAAQFYLSRNYALVEKHRNPIGGEDSKQGPVDDFANEPGCQILAVYVAHLIRGDVNYYELIPVYLRYLPPRLQVSIYKIFLSTLKPGVAQEFIRKTTQAHMFGRRVIEEIKAGYVGEKIQSLQKSKRGEIMPMETQVVTNEMEPYLDALKCYDPTSDQAILKNEANKLFREFVKDRNKETRLWNDNSILELQEFLGDRARELKNSDMVPEEVNKEYEAWQSFLDVRSSRRAFIVERETAGRTTRESERKFKRMEKKFKALVTKDDWLNTLRDERANAIVWMVDEVILACKQYEKYDAALNIVDLVADSRYNIAESFLRIKKMERFVRDAAYLWMKYRDAEANGAAARHS